MPTHNFLCSGGPDAVFIKSMSGHDTLNLYFCIRWDLHVMLCVPVLLGQETSTHYFSCSGGAGADRVEVLDLSVSGDTLDLWK
jgi:hypothetical protein